MWHDSYMPNLIDLVGKTFGSLTVIAKSTTHSDKQGNVFWDCKCACGKTISIRSPSLRTGNTRSCGCKQYSDRSMLAGSKSKLWTGYEEIPRSTWSQIERQARQRKISFDVTIQSAWKLFLTQKRKCALTGDSLYFGGDHGKLRGNASLDRINPDKGYVLGNIQWVTRKINMMKWTLQQGEFIDLCRKVSLTQTNQ
jgi:hypothetical protein